MRTLTVEKDMTHKRSHAKTRTRALSGGLGRRLLMWFLLLSLIPLLGSNTIGYLRTQVIIEGLVERYLGGIADLQARRVQEGVEQHFLYLSALGTGNRFLEAAAERQRGVDRLEMNEVADSIAAHAYLVRQLDELGAFEDLALVQLDGTVIAATGEGPWESFLDSRESPRLLVVRGRSSDAPPLLCLGVVIQDEDGLSTAYLLGTIALGHASNFLEIPEHVAGSIESFILDEAGLPLFVSHTHGHVAYDAPLSTPLLDLPIGSTLRYRDREGVEVLGTSVGIPEYSWLFLNEVPVDDALVGLRQLRSVSLIIGLLFTLMVAGAAWLVAGGIVAPIERLVAATRSVAGGDLGARVEVDVGDEIGELGHAFNHMAEELSGNAARIAELHQLELERAEQLATVGQLASGLAHEIKNPVIGISSGLDLVVRRVGADEKLSTIVAEMKRQLRRIESAIKDLLAFARPPSPTLLPSQINKIVRHSIVLVEPAAQKAGVSLVLELGEELPDLLLDSDLVGQAVINLVINAVHATENGGQVILSTRELEGAVELTVRDTGSGITAENLKHLFRPFFTTRHSGTGLGLSITQSIVERHGGRITVDTVVGEGSCFTIVFPEPSSTEPVAVREET